jgi:hypothetical protein
VSCAYALARYLEPLGRAFLRSDKRYRVPVRLEQRGLLTSRSTDPAIAARGRQRRRLYRLAVPE